MSRFIPTHLGLTVALLSACASTNPPNVRALDQYSSMSCAQIAAERTNLDLAIKDAAEKKDSSGGGFGGFGIALLFAGAAGKMSDPSSSAALLNGGTKFAEQYIDNSRKVVAEAAVEHGMYTENVKLLDKYSELRDCKAE